MANILQPVCNFLHWFFRCHLPVETVDMEVRITSIQGTHMFRRDRMCQVIKCNPWNTRLCSHSTIIQKMKTYLELEGKFGPIPQPQSNQSRPIQPDTNPCVRKETKATEKRKRLISTKKYKLKVVARPNSSNATMQPPLTAPNAPTNSEGQNLYRKVLQEQPTLLKSIPVHAGIPWSKAGKMSGNVYELRKDWPIHPTNNTATASISKPSINLEAQA